MTAVIVWFRQDLRLRDNPALSAAIETGLPVIPLYIHAPQDEDGWPAGAASRWWLHHSLTSLSDALNAKDSRLIVRTGQTIDVLEQVVREADASAIFFNRRYEPAARTIEADLTDLLAQHDVETHPFDGNLLVAPDAIANKQGKPFQVFTPFYKTCLAGDVPAPPLPRPRSLRPPDDWPTSMAIDDLDLLPELDWADSIEATWTPGEEGAGKTLRRFSSKAVEDYDNLRDRPDLPGTSRLSPHLHYGELSPRQVWHAVRPEINKQVREGKDLAAPYVRQLYWREFAHHLLWHFPHTPDEPLREAFGAFPWRRNKVLLEAWQKGRTGYPIVDAGMRELWATGWMHNRVRMIVASFLVKDLMVPWQDGARWFWDTLVDADLANNTLGWQWTAGCGADAAPFFRVFNPVSQGERFDPDGDYVRRWLPELADLPNKWIQKPWQAPADVLSDSGVHIGQDYPSPIVDHDEARRNALAAFRRMKNDGR